MRPDPLLATLASFLFLPLALGLWARATALRAKSSDPAPAWFAFIRRLQLINTLHPLAWYFAVTMTASHLPAWPSTVSTLGPSAFAGLLLAVLVLPFVAILPLAILRHDVARRLGATERTWSEALRQMGWTFGATVVPLAGLAIGLALWSGGHLLLFASCAIPGLAIGMLSASRFRRALGIHPHAITQGELRDHLFALAGRAGVHLTQLYVLPMKRTRMANAFAVNGGRVMLTDLLLQQLTREQVDAVMAHEIGHLRRHDPLKLAFSRLFFPIAGGLALQPFGYPYAFLGFIAGAVASTAWSRRIERATDREALRLGASGEALIAGLVRIAKLSLVPISWSGWSGWYLTHPSVEARARAIGRAAQLPDARVDALLAGENPPGEHYEYTPAQAATERLFSTPYKVRSLSRSSLAMLALAVGGPAVFARVAVQLGLHYGSTPWLWPAAILATFAACLWLHSVIAIRPLRALRDRLAARLHLGPPSASPGWRYVGLSPHGDPRVYEGFSAWDLGFVRVSGQVLEFLGEESRFALRREQLVSVALVDGPPSWFRTRCVRIGWNVGNGCEGLLRLTPIEDTDLGAISVRARALADEIESWRLAEDALGARIAPRETVPPSGEVTSITPRQFARPALFVRFAILDLAVAAIASAALGLPFDPARGFGWIEVAASGLMVQTLMLWPILTSRRPARKLATGPPRVLPIGAALTAKAGGQARAAQAARDQAPEPQEKKRAA